MLDDGFLCYRNDGLSGLSADDVWEQAHGTHLAVTPMEVVSRPSRIHASIYAVDMLDM